MGVCCALALALALALGLGLQHGAAAAAKGRAAKLAHHARHGHQRHPRRHHRAFSRSKNHHARALRRLALKHPTLTLKSSFIHRAQAADMRMPFTIRLRRTYEGGPGDDVLALNWDPSAVAWPLGGTAPATSPATANLDGAMTYVWDFGADTSGYAVQGTTETTIGSGVSLTSSSRFDIAVPDNDPCEATQSLSATGMALTSGGARFGIVNPFNDEVSGTIDLRTEIRTEATPCGGGTPMVATASTADPDRPLPVAFTGTFTVSPAITADGHFRLGLLTIDDTVTPQRTTFGLVYACADPAAADGCGREAFPVRTKFLSLTAEVLAGDAMPGPPIMPSGTVPSSTSTTTTSSTTMPSTTSLMTPPATLVVK